MPSIMLKHAIAIVYMVCIVYKSSVTCTCGHSNMVACGAPDAPLTATV